MFGFSAKRRRGDDLEEHFLHENKRSRPTPLPLRGSFISHPPTLLAENHQFPPRSIPPSLTPVDSSDDDDDNGMQRGNAYAMQDGRPAHPITRPPALVLESAMDLDMTDSHPLADGDNLSPWPVSAKNCGSVQPSPIPHHLINQSLNISGGRTATPIYGHFTVNMNAEAMMEDDPTLPTHTSAFKSSEVETSEEKEWWRRRRLPSPISEDEGSKASISRNYATAVENHQGSYLPDSPPLVDSSHKPSAFWPVTSEPEGFRQKPENLNTSMEATTAALLRNRASFADLAGNGKESLVGTNSAAGKGKISFSMGYRADCDKCRRKIPGHYSHIIRS